MILRDGRIINSIDMLLILVFVFEFNLILFYERNKERMNANDNENTWSLGVSSRMYNLSRVLSSLLFLLSLFPPSLSHSSSRTQENIYLFND
jgi:hypothetical protein